MCYTHFTVRRVYLPSHTHYASDTRLRIKNVNHTHSGQFLTPVSQFHTTCSLTIKLKNWIQFSPKAVQWMALNVLLFLNNKLTRLCQGFELRNATFGNLQKSLEHLRNLQWYSGVVGIMFSNVRESSEIFQKFSQCGCENLTHESGKVGRYRRV